MSAPVLQMERKGGKLRKEEGLLRGAGKKEVENRRKYPQLPFLEHLLHARAGLKAEPMV